MRDRDLLYISNAPAVELVKVLQILRIGLATVNEFDAARVTVGRDRR
jgi:hypothetical protein